MGFKPFLSVEEGGVEDAEGLEQVEDEAGDISEGLSPQDVLLADHDPSDYNGTHADVLEAIQFHGELEDNGDA